MLAVELTLSSTFPLDLFCSLFSDMNLLGIFRYLAIFLGLMAEPALPAKAGAGCLFGTAGLDGKILNK